MPSREDLEEELHTLRKYKRNMESTANPLATVLEVSGDKAVVSSGCGPLAEAFLPNFEVLPGHRVTIHPQTMQVVSKVDYQTGGSIAVVKSCLSDRTVEIEGMDHHSRIVILSPTVKDVEKGCRVQLDNTGHVIVFNLGKPAESFIRGETPVQWDDIGGLADIKQQLQETVEYPHRYPEIYKAYNKKPPKGILFDGPPGCGKTMLAKAVATSLSGIYEKKHGGLLTSAFLYVKGPEILSKWVGEAERAVRDIFARAADHKRQYNYPAVVFIDEADAILSKRGTGVSSDMEKTIVTSFLAEMDGMDESAAFIMLATNRANLIDPAVLRDGRIDKKLFVRRPDPQSAADIIALNLRKVPTNKVSIKLLAETAIDTIWSDRYHLGEFGSKEGKGKIHLYLRDLVSGAMAANCVSLAIEYAIRRDVAHYNGGGKFKPSGVTVDDIISAADVLFDSTRRLDHEDVLEEVAERERKIKQETREIEAA